MSIVKTIFKAILLFVLCLGSMIVMVVFGPMSNEIYGARVVISRENLEDFNHRVEQLLLLQNLACALVSFLGAYLLRLNLLVAAFVFLATGVFWAMLGIIDSDVMWVLREDAYYYFVPYGVFGPLLLAAVLALNKKWQRIG